MITNNITMGVVLLISATLAFSAPPAVGIGANPGDQVDGFTRILFGHEKAQ